MKGKRRHSNGTDRLQQLRGLVELSLRLSGDPAVVFERVVRMIAELFQVRVVCLSEIAGRQLLFKAVYVGGKVLSDAGTCPLDITPCASVEEAKDLRVYDRVQERFPQAMFLRDHNADAYCGFPSLDSEGKVVAVTCLLDDKPRTFAPKEQELLRLIAQRIASELERGKINAERRRVDQALCESEERLRLAVQASGQGTWDLDLTTQEATVSPEHAAMLGFDPREFKENRDSFRERLHPDDRERVFSTFEAYLRGDFAIFDSEFRLLTKSGAWKWIHSLGKIVSRASDGRALRMLGTHLDIDHRKRGDEALRHSEQRLQRVIAATNDGIWDWNKQNGENYLSPRWKQILGYRDDELPNVESSFFSLLHPDDKPRLDNALVRHLEMGEPFVLELRLRHKDGTYRWVLNRGEALRGHQGIVVTMAGAITDITERKVGEIQIKRLNRVYAVLSDINRTIIRVRDPQAIFDAACQIAVEKGGFRMAWIGRLDGKTGTITPVAAAGVIEGYLETGNANLHDDLRSHGLTGAALRQGKPSICNDVERDSRMAPWREEALRRGYRSVAAFPVKIHGETIGCFNLYADKTDFFDDEELRLLNELAIDISFALETSQHEAERKRAEEAFKLFRTLVDQSNDTIEVVDPETGRFLDVNERGCVDLGYSRKELLALSVFDIDPMISQSAFARVVGDLRKSGVLLWEGIHRRKDGSTFPVEVNIKYAQLDRDYIVTVVRDITERKQAEAKLRLQAAALESAANSIVITDRTGRVTWANAAFSRSTGYTLEEVLGQNPRLLKSGQHDQAFYRHLWETILAGHVWHSEMINRRKDGEIYTEAVTITPVRDERGEIGHFIMVKQDISDRKRAELELEQTHNQLLAVSRQAAIAEFATGILHNVGNVLNSVGVASSCLAESLRKSKAARLSQVVALMREHEADLGAFFTNDPKGKLVPGYLAQLAEKLAGEQATALQEIAQLQNNLDHIKAIITVQQNSAKGSTVPELLKLTDLVDDALKMNSNALARASIQVTKEFAEIPPVMVQKHGVLQILVNLVRNAIQACEASASDHKRLIIRVSQSNDRLLVAVVDNGMGISGENLTRIFTLGFTTKKDGHGFGLHSSLLAAKEMGGSLTVQSDGPGRGTTFNLELPVNSVIGS